MENFRSTFPINEAAIARKALGKILTDPVSWVPLVPPVAAYTIFDVPAPLSLGAGVLIFAGVGAYWRKHWPEITNGFRRQAVTEHNRAQDAILKASVDELRLAKETGLAQKLDPFLLIKRQVETRLHEDGELTAQKIQLEQLVDSLCFGVRDQLQALRLREGSDAERQTVLTQVDEAFQTLQAAVAELDSILGPRAVAGAGGTSLDELTRRLREETEIARRVQARLRAQEQSAGSVELPREENQ